jgi:hypothetical protein
MTGCSSGLGSLLGGVLSTGASVYGSQNAAEANTNANISAMGTAQTTLGNINSIYGTQQNLGQGADVALGSALGTNGQPANYSNFLNMPGYQFAINQGTQAIQRQAAAQGNSYTPNEQEAVGQYVTGTASQDYNTYISQLEQAAGLGQQANSALTGANLQTAGNVEQEQINTGLAQAQGYNASGTAVGSAIGNILGTGANGSGISNLFGGGGSSSTGCTPDYTSTGGTYGNPNAATEYATPNGNGGFNYSGLNSPTAGNTGCGWNGGGGNAPSNAYGAYGGTGC